MRSLEATRAYRKSSSHRNIRDQEADVFRFVNASLRGLDINDTVAIAKAIANNERLWITVMDSLADGLNQLPLPTRVAIMSVGHTARREMASGKPDLDFLINLNEQIAAGLEGS